MWPLLTKGGGGKHTRYTSCPRFDTCPVLDQLGSCPPDCNYPESKPKKPTSYQVVVPLKDDRGKLCRLKTNVLAPREGEADVHDIYEMLIIALDKLGIKIKIKISEPPEVALSIIPPGFRGGGHWYLVTYRVSGADNGREIGPKWLIFAPTPPAAYEAAPKELGLECVCRPIEMKPL